MVELWEWMAVCIIYIHLVPITNHRCRIEKSWFFSASKWMSFFMCMYVCMDVSMVFMLLCSVQEDKYSLKTVGWPVVCTQWDEDGSRVLMQSLGQNVVIVQMLVLLVVKPVYSGFKAIALVRAACQSSVLPRYIRDSICKGAQRKETSEGNSVLHAS